MKIKTLIGLLVLSIFGLASAAPNQLSGKQGDTETLSTQEQRATYKELVTVERALYHLWNGSLSSYKKTLDKIRNINVIIHPDDLCWDDEDDGIEDCYSKAGGYGELYRISSKHNIMFQLYGVYVDGDDWDEYPIPNRFEATQYLIDRGIDLNFVKVFKSACGDGSDDEASTTFYDETSTILDHVHDAGDVELEEFLISKGAKFVDEL